MATADELKAFEMVHDHEKRLKRLEGLMADQIAAKDIEAGIADKYPQTAPAKAKK